MGASSTEVVISPCTSSEYQSVDDTARRRAQKRPGSRDGGGAKGLTHEVLPGQYLSAGWGSSTPWVRVLEREIIVPDFSGSGFPGNNIFRGRVQPYSSVGVWDPTSGGLAGGRAAWADGSRAPGERACTAIDGRPVPPYRPDHYRRSCGSTGRQRPDTRAPPTMGGAWCGAQTRERPQRWGRVVPVCQRCYSQMSAQSVPGISV